MMFPDCRNDDIYNEDFLDDKGKEFLLGMDYAFEQIKNLIENNIDVYENELNEMLEEGEEAEEGEVFAQTENLFEIIASNTEILSAIIEDWYEAERNEAITSLIEDMDDNKYNEIRTRVLKENKDKEYFDTRKYIYTGKKERSE